MGLFALTRSIHARLNAAFRCTMNFAWGSASCLRLTSSANAGSRRGGKVNGEGLPAEGRRSFECDVGDAALHRGVDAVCQCRARFARAVVVLPHGHVSAAAGEVDLKDAGILLQSLAGDANRVVADAGVAVETLWMRGER